LVCFVTHPTLGFCHDMPSVGNNVVHLTRV
jgi:hypothetical protein